MKKVIRVFVFVLAIVVAVNKPVLADPLTDQLQNQQSQLNNDKRNLREAQDRLFGIEQNLEELDNEVESLMDQVESNKKQVKNIQAETATAEKEMKQAELDMKKEQELFNQRLRVIYINGVDGYLQILLDSNGFKDFLSRVETLKNIIELDKKITASLEEKQKNLEEKKQKLSEQNIKLLALNSENSKKMDNLKVKKDEQAKLIDEARRQESMNEAVVSASQSKVNETLRQIEAIRKASPKYTPSRGAAPISSNAVVAYASNFMGTPYKWGGTTPAGFDCSGFTQYVYRHFGVYLGRTTYDQIKNGRAVSREELQPGDLVFYGRGGSPTHMGIYVGNGMYIHSPRTGDVIKISPYDRSDYITARRVM